MKEKIINEAVRGKFREYLENEERSKGTIDKYMRDIRSLEDWLGGEPVTKDKLNGWKQHLMESGRAPSTINSMIAAVNSFLKFIGWGECAMRSIRLQKRFFRTEARDLSKDEYEKLLKTAYRKGNEKMALIMETMCATGIRVSEVRYITTEAVRSGKAEIYLKGKHRVVLLPHRLCVKLRAFAKKHGIKGEIFITKNGTGLDRRQIWASMKALCKLAGVAAEKVFPHNLRHLFAKRFYEKFKDVVSLSDVLGHSSVETTRIYLINTEEEHVKKIARLGLVI